ncbi:MAG: cobaltochelatase subunit CobN [Thiohalophilus sp.]
MVAGARLFNRNNPQHTIRLRTTDQIADYTDQQLITMLREADAIFMAGIFGDATKRLQKILQDADLPAHVPVFITNSDRRMIRLSRLDQHRPLQDLDSKQLTRLNRNPEHNQPYQEYLDSLVEQFPEQRDWLALRAYWQNRSSENIAGLIARLLQHADSNIDSRPVIEQAAVRYYYKGRLHNSHDFQLDADKPLVPILDYNTGDRSGNMELLDELCQALEQRDLQCLAVLARWGEASLEALRQLESRFADLETAAIINLQDFTVGGGEYRRRATKQLEQLNVPVLKGIRMSDRTRNQWHSSVDGIPWDNVHYQVAMPEVQGSSQPIVLAAASKPRLDPLTGVELSPSVPITRQIRHISERVARWHRLQEQPNQDKRIAIVYYNHPPGRHNIGADNLDVPASLWQVLNQLQQAGYQTGPLPETPQALLEQIQQQGVNLPNNHDALEAMAPRVTRLKLSDYRDWFARLPESVRGEVQRGPLAYLHSMVDQAIEDQEHQLAKNHVKRLLGDIRHLVDGVDHPARQRALDLLDQLHDAYRDWLKGEDKLALIRRLNSALYDTGIEGLNGWGEPPGEVMVSDGQFLLPGIRFGNVFIGPQPPRGWEINEELLHANLAFPPTHQYLAFYKWLQQDFKADALIHLGRHSTYEFLPRRRVGLTGADYPGIIAGEIPGVYPYIVDGVGEGIQAKRRGLAVIVDHLTPPLKTTALYDDLLELRQLVESFESAQQNSPARRQAVTDIKQLVEELKLREELEAIMEEELEVRGIGFEQIEDELLVHEVGHYLTEMQEHFMPMGLHVFGRRWEDDAVAMMLDSMQEKATDSDVRTQYQAALENSPDRENQALLDGLNGRFVKPGKGNDPIRTPGALPTGRNFHALDGSLLPTRIGYELGVKLAEEARQKNPPGEQEGSEAIVLWASEAVRDEGAMVAFGLDMLGIRPVWNSRGIFKRIERVALKDGRTRRDTLFTTSGLFRDLYANLLVWLDKAVLLALDGASETIRRDYPQLEEALDHALAPLGKLADPGDESLAQNRVAANWVRQAKKLLQEDKSAAIAGRLASLRLFGDAPGSYGAGVNRLAERSGSWEDRGQLSRAYIHRMGHAYGAKVNGLPAHDSFRASLGNVTNTYLGRASNLYGLMDNNDAFDYLGGLSMAVENIAGKTPNNHVIQHADPQNAGIQSLDSALLQELRGRFLNPAWLKALMKHDYAGARTMGSEFMEYLWGWQVTNPEIIKSWVWDEVKEVYIDDRHQLGLDEFLEQGDNAHVKTNMLAIMLVAADKQFWQADPATLEQLAEKFAQLVIEHGLPGSGHTRPNHPVMQSITPLLDESTRQAFQQVLDAATGPEKTVSREKVTTTISEIEPAQSDEGEQKPTPDGQSDQRREDSHQSRLEKILILIIALAIILGGIVYEKINMQRRRRT